MRFHFNSITEESEGHYIYEYHTQKRAVKTLGYALLAGIAGTLRIWNDASSTRLVLFWVGVFTLSKIVDFIIDKTDIAGRSISVKFVSKFPHYVFTDITWMLKNNKKNFMLGEIIEGATDSYGKRIEIGIGSLSAKKIRKADFTKETLKEAIEQQRELEHAWSERTGERYPDLEMPKR